jgi:hypothetical protein
VRSWGPGVFGDRYNGLGTDMIESAEEFVRLRSSSKQQEYLRAAHDKAPKEVWLEVIERYPEYKAWVAHNKTVPLSVLKILAGDPDPDVRFTVAMKRKAGEEILSLLARDSDEAVRSRVVYNPKVTEAVLKILLEDPNAKIAAKARERMREFSKRKEAEPDCTGS